MKIVQDYLQELGLSEIEAKLYQGLLEKGPSTVMELATHVGLKRITVHFNIESLIQKGLVTESREGARRQIVAEPPERLKYLLDQRFESIKSLRDKFTSIVNLIDTNYPQAKAGEEIAMKYYKGKGPVELIYQDAMKAKEFRAYVNVKELAKAFPQNVDAFLDIHRKRKEMQIWEIMENSNEAKKYVKKMPKERYFYRIIPPHLNLSVVDYMLFDGKVAIVDLKEDTSGTIISNNNYYANAKGIFEFVWQMLDQPE